MDEEKRLPFARSFEALGVVIDFKRSTAGEVEIRNKEAMLDSTEVMVREIIKTKELPQSTATMLRGKVQYAEGQLFNRVAAIMMPEVRARASGKSPGSWLHQEAEQELHWAMSFFRNAPPRKLLAYDPRPPLRICIDAAQEGAFDEIATIDAVMFDQGEVVMFGLKLSPK